MFREKASFWIYGVLGAAVIAVLGPLSWIIGVSLQASETLAETGHLSLANYKEVLFGSSLPLNFVNSLVLASATAALTLVFASSGAYAATRFRFRGQQTLFRCVLLMSMVPMIAVLIPLYSYLASIGMLNTYQVLIAVYTAANLPATLWLMQSYFERVAIELEEAALIDGCTKLRAFWHVLLPQLRPAIIACGMIVFVNVWNDFLIGLTLASKPEMRTMSVGLFFYMGEAGIDWGRLTAGAVLSMLPPVGLFLFLQRYLVHGLSSGALKG